ncbi:MAG TPA: Spy/CpxP family protein refolding chaperone [Gemmatimonadaceae bacterium]|nr:Spy/CpxP family protein refolding chaperone [Gemmatimonadaceae bacterium]
MRTAATRLALTLAAVTFVAVATPTQAQPPAGGGGGRGGMMSPQAQHDMMFKDITLTADQQAKVKEIEEQYQPQLDKMRADMRAARQSGQSMDRESMQKMRDLQAEERKALRDVLTADQQATFDRNIEAMSQRRGGRGGGRPPQA